MVGKRSRLAVVFADSRRTYPVDALRSWTISRSKLQAIGDCEFCLRPGDADGEDEEATAVLLMREDMLDPGADR